MTSEIKEIIQFILPVCGAIAAGVVFWRNILQTRKLNLEVQQLKRKLENEDSRVQVATLEEVEKYGKHVYISQKINQSTLLVFFVVFLGAPFIVGRDIEQSNGVPLAGTQGRDGVRGDRGEPGPPGEIAMYSGICSAGPSDPTNIGSGRRTTVKHVKFSTKFESLPEVYIAISGFDLINDSNHRLRVYPTNITESGFTCNIETWENTSVYAASVQWFAYKANKSIQPNADASAD